jgi:hypothetical protein
MVVKARENNMASYFVSCAAPGEGGHLVHDRGGCPPGRFGPAGSEYLGEFLDPAQALLVARLRYARVRPCDCCAAPVPRHPEPLLPLMALTPLRP